MHFTPISYLVSGDKKHIKLQNLKNNKKLWLLISQIFADLSTGESFLAKLSLGARLITSRLTGLSRDPISGTIHGTRLKTITKQGWTCQRKQEENNFIYNFVILLSKLRKDIV